VDCVELNTFLEAKHLLNSRVDYLTLDVNELSSRRLGGFDVVLFFGAAYHVRHPLLGLERVVDLSKDLALVESFTIPSEDRSARNVMEFYERGELGGDRSTIGGVHRRSALWRCTVRPDSRVWNLSM
jgi:hypothetical protein